MFDKLWLWTARQVPRRLRYWCTIVAASEASTGQWSGQLVPDLLVTDVLKRTKV
jgi:hypothetical protein